VLDVGGQRSHARGRVHARRVGDEAVYRIDGEAPRWVRDRPLEARVRVDGDRAEVTVARRTS
jgi:hypothetical protein